MSSPHPLPRFRPVERIVQRAFALSILGALTCGVLMGTLPRSWDVALRVTFAVLGALAAVGSAVARRHRRVLAASLADLGRLTPAERAWRAAAPRHLRDRPARSRGGQRGPWALAALLPLTLFGGVFVLGLIGLHGAVAYVVSGIVAVHVFMAASANRPA